MKKILAMVLSILLVLAMATTAVAAVPGESKSIDVTGKYNSTTTEATVYSVDILWESMTFTYNETMEKVWNAENHTYTTNTSGAWDKTSASITVTNHSNAAVTASVAYTAMANTGITGTLSATHKTLAAGVEGKPNEADALLAVLTISGKPTETVTNSGVKIGSITITLS